MNDTRPLRIQQAEALRRLADAVEATPGLAEVVDLPLRYLSTTFKQDARARLETFLAGMTAAGAEVTVDNAVHLCTVDASFGAVQLKVWATADAMKADMPSPPAPKYAPLVSRKDGSK